MNAALAAFIAINLLFAQPQAALWSAPLLWLAFSWPVLLRPRPADLVTALRLSLALAAFALIQTKAIPGLAGGGLFGFALALDGVDGWLARRTGPTAFGARFDMESDNAFLAALWLATYAIGQSQPYGLLLGLGLIIPMYRIALVALRALGLVAKVNTAQPDNTRPKRLLGLPREKLLFVAVAALSLASYALTLAAATLPALAATAVAVACSTWSFWPDFFPPTPKTR